MVEATSIRRSQRDTGEQFDNTLVVEEPLEIRLQGETVAVTMRTPGDDADLALGFLFAEGILESPDDVSSVARCGQSTDAGFQNTIDVVPAHGAHAVFKKLDFQRRGTITSSCGVCGRETIDDLMTSLRPVKPRPLSRELVARATEVLSRHQPHFATTGGLHAAALLDADGTVLHAAEDIGRHNAVDKSIGRLFKTRGLERALVLVVSGRVSFEIVQKAARAGVSGVVGVSAASTLAVDLAERAGLTLVSFARNGHFTALTHWARLVSPAK